jgi:hypothetical protein
MGTTTPPVRADRGHDDTLDLTTAGEVAAATAGTIYETLGTQTEPPVPAPRKTRTSTDARMVRGCVYADGITDPSAFAQIGWAGGDMRCLQAGTVGIFSPAAEWTDGDVVCIYTRSIAAPAPTGRVGRIITTSESSIALVSDFPRLHARLFRRSDVLQIAAMVEIRTAIVHGAAAAGMHRGEMAGKRPETVTWLQGKEMEPRLDAAIRAEELYRSCASRVR